MTLTEYIKMPQEYEPIFGNTEVVMTHSGYYAEGGFTDLLDVPEVSVLFDKSNRKVKKEYIVLGHSEQN